MKTALYFFHSYLPETHIQSLFFTTTAQYTHPIPTNYIVLTVIFTKPQTSEKTRFFNLTIEILQINTHRRCDIFANL